MARTSNILVGLLLFTFIGLCAAAVRFMQNPDMPPIPSEKDDIKKEGFKNAPTRAADCQCLPGYVPVKMSESGFFVRLSYNPSPGREGFWYNYVNMKTKINHELTMSYSDAGYKDEKVKEIYSEFMRNIPIKQMNFYSEWIPFAQQNNIQWTGSIVGPWNIKNVIDTTESNTYYCVSLANPTDSKKCY